MHLAPPSIEGAQARARFPLWGLLALGAALSAAALPARALGVTEVPVLPPPDATQEWTMSGTCVDINEAGVAACTSIAVGPPYRCGWRGAQTCHDVVKRVGRWDGVAFTTVAGETASQPEPVGIAESGAVYGYVYDRQIYGPQAGRIWQADGRVSVVEGPVLWVTAGGRYVAETATVTGGSTMVYSDVLHEADGTPVPVFGLGGGGFTGTAPQVADDTGRVAGAQILQAAGTDAQGNTVPEVSGAGWFVDQAVYDRLPRNEEGMLDVYGPQIWPTSYARPTGGFDWRSLVSDLNTAGELVIQSDATSVGSGAQHAVVCSPWGRTAYHAPNGKTYWGRYRCLGGWQGGATGFNGLNDRGDLVGAWLPYGATTAVPMVWRRDARNTRLLGALDLNAALAPTGWTVLRVHDVNNRRQVAGTCRNAAGAQRGCVIQLD